MVVINHSKRNKGYLVLPAWLTLFEVLIIMQDSTQKPELKLLDQVRGKIRLKHYSIRTEQAYVDWIKRFVLHFGKRHPRELGAAEVEQFLTYLAVQGKVAASTQNQNNIGTEPN